MFFSQAKPSSKEVANERLKLILMSDRSCIPLELLEMIKNEILDVISKYIELNKALAEISVINSESEDISSSIIVASIPIKKSFK